jgi:hypothetical protein
MPLSQPKTKHEFTDTWQNGIDVAEIYSGEVGDDGKKKKVFPNADERQEELIRDTYNAAILTVLQQEIEKGKSLSKLVEAELLQRGHITTIQKKLGRKKKRDNQKLLEYIRENNLFVGFDDVITPSSMQTFKQQVIQEIEEAILESRDSATPIDPDILTDIPKQPVHPAIANFNTKYAATILEIRDSGAKQYSRAKEKYSVKKEITDINRITVCPLRPAIADNFCANMDALMKKKTRHRKKDCPVFLEPWAINPRGLMDRNMFIALTDSFPARRSADNKNVIGTIAEVKIESPSMQRASDESRYIFRTVRKLLKDDLLNIKHTTQDESLSDAKNMERTNERLRFMTMYNRAANYYSRLSEKYKGASGSYRCDWVKLTEKDESDFGKEQDLTDRYDELRMLNCSIYTAAAANSSLDWQRVYVEKVYEHNAKFANEKHKQIPAELLESVSESLRKNTPAEEHDSLPTMEAAIEQLQKQGKAIAD